MKVTITPDSDEELQEVLDSTRTIKMTSKEDIEELLSLNLIEALNSPRLRIAIRRKIIKELKKTA